MNKDYAVVEFLSEMVDNQPLVQEVPANWLCNNATMCWWPPRNALKEIRGASNPDVTSWQQYDVRVRKVYGDFNEARQRCLMPSDIEEEEMGKHRRKKKESFKHMFRDLSHSPPPQPPSSCAFIADNCQDNSITDEPHTEIAYPNYNIRSPTYDVPDTIALSSSGSSFNRCPTTSSGPERPELTTLTTVNRLDNSSRSELIPPEIRAAQSRSTNASNSSIDEIKDCLKTLTDEIHSMRKQIQEVILHVINIEEQLETKLKGKSEINRRFKNIFPLKDEGDLRKLCESLDESPQLLEDLKLHLNGIGGSGPKDHHARMFKHIFSNDLGMKCTWKGQRGNIKLENVNCISACMYVLRQMWKTTDKEFEMFSQDWLRHCSQRKKREEGRNNIG